ncbi:MAG: sensor histidine kinase [Gemmatimonadales bacterium]
MDRNPRPTSTVFGIPRLRRSARSSTTLLGLVLFAAVGLSCWLALQAYAAARSHRQTTEAVLRDYAQVAAAEYSRTARVGLYRFFDVAFDEIPRRRRFEELPDIDEVERDLDDAMRELNCFCPGFLNPVSLVRMRLPGGEIDYEIGPVSPHVTDAVLAHATATYEAEPSERYGFFQLRAPSPEGVSAAAYATVQYETGELEAIYAVLVDSSALTQLARHWHSEAELLPSAIAKGLPTDSALFVRLQRPDGSIVFESPVAYELTFTAADTLSAALGSLVVTAAVRPEAASRLVIGGLPRSRLPMSLALIGLTLAVGAGGLLEMRRHEQLARLREGFVSSVSHELRTPLTQIRMLAELLSDDKLRSSGERTRAVHIIHREAQRLTQLVENILQFSRIRAAGGAEELRDVDLDAAVHEAVASFQPLAESAGATVKTDAATGLAVQGQREGVRRILMNLLDNALKYGPAGQTVEVHAEAENGTVRLVVQDEGPGIPEPDRQRVWEPYWRLPRDVDSVRPGSGVGLAVVRSLARQYGGEAWVEAAPRAGSRFVVELPLASARPAPDGAAALPVSMAST